MHHAELPSAAEQWTITGRSHSLHETQHLDLATARSPSEDTLAGCTMSTQSIKCTQLLV